MHEHWILLACATFCAAAPVIAADTYPVKTVRVVAPFAPGGGSDTVARTVAQQFAEQLGKSFVVDNRTGASGMIAYDIVAKSAPDGHTLLVTNSAFASLPGLFKSLPYDPVKSFTPVSEILRAPNVLVVHPFTNVNTGIFQASCRLIVCIQAAFLSSGESSFRAPFSALRLSGFK